MVKLLSHGSRITESCLIKPIAISWDSMLKLKFKKLMGLISKTTTLRVQHTFFVNFFPVTARLRRQNA